MSVQMRGGPEPLMVTGWVQIMSLGRDTYMTSANLWSSCTPLQCIMSYFGLTPLVPSKLLRTSYKYPALDPSYIGVYHCIAGNDRGKVYAVANVGVYKNGDDL